MNNNEITERCVLLSLNPYWWQKIYDGFKNLEIRKTAPSGCTWPIRVLVYLTTPRKEIVGEFISEGYVKTNVPRYLARGSMLSSVELSEYAKGKPIYGWMVFNPIEYRIPHKLEELGIKRAPQSWCYCEAPASWMHG